MTNSNEMFPDYRRQPTMSVAEAGRWWGVSRPQAFKLAKSGAIPTIPGTSPMRVPTRKVALLLGFPVDDGEA